MGSDKARSCGQFYDVTLFTVKQQQGHKPKFKWLSWPRFEAQTQITVITGL